MAGHSPGIGLPHDPSRARQLLAAAGYPEGRGFPAVEALAPEPMAVQAEALRAQWRSTPGVEVRWQLLAWPRLLEALAGGLPDLFLSGWAADYPDPENFLGTGARVSGRAWHNEAFERLLCRSRATFDQKERIALLQQADRLLTQQGPFLPLYYWRYGLLVKPWVRRYPLSPMGPDVPHWQDVVIDPH